MKSKYFYLLLGIFLSLGLEASIICPADITIDCTMDPHNLNMLGRPTVYNASGQIRYNDQRTHTQCNAGSIVRTWYIDANGNGQLDPGEFSCSQNIDINYISGSVTITFPPNREYECREAIQIENPTWHSTGPCDIIGVSRQDIVFEADGESCYKILRNWTVINWCTYIPGGSEGIWSHTQLIKVVDRSVPVIQNCRSITLGTDKGCEGTFSVSNRAIDLSPCGNQTLLWRAEVDLWADGSIEYTFGHNETNPEYVLQPVRSNQDVTITLPWPVRRGMHKVNWYVQDLCGNVSSCTQTVFVRDDKKPTPYLHYILSSAFDASQMNLMIPARIFNLGSFDNCSHSRFLRYSFSSNVNDTIRTIDCNTAGFNFFTIFITDLEGNQAEADVIVLAFDNGSCGNKASLKGQILESNGRPVADAQFKMTINGNENDVIHATSLIDGSFTFENTAIYRDNVIEPMHTQLSSRTVDVADLRMFQDYLMGMTSLEHFQYVAADLDGDGRLRSRDIMILRDRILYPQRFSEDHLWQYICDTKDISGPEMLNKIQNKVKLRETNGPLHFRAVYMGDITDANKESTQPRNQNLWNKKYENSVFSYYLQEEIEIKGLQLEIKLPDSWITVSSPYFEVNSMSAYIDDDNVLRVVVPQDIVLKSNNAILEIAVSEDTMIEPVFGNGSKILLDGYKTQNIKILHRNTSSTIGKISPNPTINMFYLNDDNAKILKIFNSVGSEINFVQSGNEVSWDANPGVYFVHVIWGDNQITTEKIIRN